MAKAYFGNEAALGRTLAGTEGDHEITLVFADLPRTQHLRYDLLMARPPLAADDEAYAIGIAKGEAVLVDNDHTYVRMAPGIGAEDFADISSRYVQRYLSHDAQRSGIDIRYYLEPLPQVHYRSRAVNDLPQGSMFALLLYGALAVLLLLVACANYINLAVARFPVRCKEACVRLVLGAGRMNLLAYFLAEALLFAGCAFPLALLAVSVLNEHGWLPALTSQLLPVPVLFKASWLVPQLVASVSVISCTLLMLRQVHFLEALPQGFDSASRVVLRVEGPERIDRLPALLAELGLHSAVRAAASSEGEPGRLSKEVPNYLESERGLAERLVTARERIRGDYLMTLGITLVAGRNFVDEDFAVVDYDGSPERKVLVNQTLVRAMQWREPIGKKIGTSTVIGVVADYRFQGLEKRVMPLVIQMDKPRWHRNTPDELAAQLRYVLVHLDGELKAGLDALSAIWSRHYPAQPFNFVLLDDLLAQNAPDVSSVAGTVAGFGSLCVLMAALGLFALTAYTTEQRRHEIGIRKVMGATLGQIMLLLFRHLAGLVLMAGVFASLLSSWVVGEWLKGFHYQQGASLSVLLLATVCMLLVALVAQLLQAARVERIRPALVLRND